MTIINSLMEMGSVRFVGVVVEDKSIFVIVDEGLESFVKNLIEQVEMIGFECSEKQPDVILSVEGMMCMKSCGNTVRNSLMNLRKVWNVEVSIEKGEVNVWINFDSTTTAQDCIDSVEMVGFGASLKESKTESGIFKSVQSIVSPVVFENHQEIEEEKEEFKEKVFITSSKHNTEVKLSISGMSCAGCVSKIEKKVMEVPFVNNIRVGLVTSSAKINYDTNRGDVSQITATITNLGYDCKHLTNEVNKENLFESQEIELLKWKNLFFISLLLSIPTFLIHIASMNESLPILSLLLYQRMHLCEWLMLLLTTPLQFGIGQTFYSNAYKGLENGMMGMDLLIATGTSSAYLYSITVMFTRYFNSAIQQECMFATSGLIITFVLLGKTLENMARRQTSQTIQRLLELQPKRALKIVDSENDVTLEINIEDIQIGDVLKILPGNKVPTDGVIVDGESCVDESMITGEPIPVLKRNGEGVFAGSINQMSVLVMRANTTGSENTISKIVDLVEEAQMNKAPIQSYADRVASLFTPTILLLSFSSFIIWILLCKFKCIPNTWLSESDNDIWLFSLQFSISVIVISCPCALGLATPTAVMVGTGVGARHGILIKV